MNEFKTKQAIIDELIARHNLDALLLSRVSSFAWATCGSPSYVNTADSLGIAQLLVTPGRRYLLTNNIEAPRLEKEEGLADQGWEFRVAPWYTTHPDLSLLTRGLSLGADGAVPGAVDLSADIAHLRANLLPVEGDRMRMLARACAEAMDAAVHRVQPGQSEFEIAGLLAHEADSRGAQAIVNLVATDERIFNFRHPIPTAKKLEKYAMLILCGRRWGLVCSITRLVHFGRLPGEIRHKAEAVAFIDANLIQSTQPGRSLGEIFQLAIQAYASCGFPEEWKLHHQGGPAGYEPREYFAIPDLEDRVAAGQAYAWNPSITGAKSEDTILIGESGNEILTEIPDWPTLAVELHGQTIQRPTILEI
jgi:antitoxin VapB